MTTPKRSTTPKPKGTLITLAFLSCQCVVAVEGDQPPPLPERCLRCGYHGSVLVARYTLTVP